MAGNKDYSRVEEQLEKDARDIADLWNDAIRQYEGPAGKKLKPQFANVQQMIDFGAAEIKGFHEFRHDKGKVDKLRGLFKDNMGYIEQGAQQLVAAATPAFPPAAAIGTAFTLMLSACKQVSADYDVVIAFFEDMNAFLQRITILETRLPAHKAYRNCLVDVFGSLLAMVGIATKYIELKRFKKWVLSLIFGEDSELAGGRKTMDTSIDRLQSATEFAILANTEQLQRMGLELQENTDMQTRMLEDQKQMLETVLQNQENFHSEMVSIRKLLVTFDQQKEGSAKQRSSKAGGQSKPPTSTQVRAHYMRENDGEDMVDPDIEYRDLKDSVIEDTCTWIFEEPVWQNWAAQEANAPRILVISGPVGAGKSHTAVAAYDHLKSKAGEGTCVVHFYFRETIDGLYETYNAMTWAVIQVAEQNTLLCERINSLIAREDVEVDYEDWRDVWNNFLKPLFVANPKVRLQIVLDGLDEVVDWDRECLLAFFQEINQAPGLNVSVLCTVREGAIPELVKTAPHTLELKKDKQLSDLRALIWRHLESGERLRKLSRYMKQKISNVLEEQSDVLLYATLVLRQLDTLGRAPVILKRLQNLPDNLEGIYQWGMDDLQSHIPAGQQQTMRDLLAWLAFASRELTLDESLSLLKFCSGHSFDLEEELQGQRLSKILKMTELDDRSREPTQEPPQASASGPNEAQQEMIPSDGELPLRFVNRSMRDFVSSAPQGESSLRIPESEAHRRIFVLSSKILTGTVEGAHQGLCEYVAENWLWHQSSVLSDQHNKAEKVEFLQALAAIINNVGNVAKRFEELDSSYEDMQIGLDDGQAIDNLAHHASCILEIGEDSFDPATWTWATAVTANKRTALEPLLKAHIINWLEATDLTSALSCFGLAHAVSLLTTFNGLVESDEESSETDDNSDDDESDDDKHDEKVVLALSRAFPDIELKANALWAIAAKLEQSGHYRAAQKQARSALSKAVDPIERFRILACLASIQLDLERPAQAEISVVDALSTPDVPPKLRRDALVLRGRAQAKQDNYDAAAASYADARRCIPDEAVGGDILQEEFNLYYGSNEDSNKNLVDIVKGWTPLERLAWMTWNYSEDASQHDTFRWACGTLGAEEFMVEVYEEVIDRLDNFNAGAPLRYELAVSHQFVRNDLEAARTMFNAILDSSATHDYYRFTDEDPAYTLALAINMTVDVLYEQFRATADPLAKRLLLTETNNLLHRPLVLSVHLGSSDLVHHTVILAQMTRKSGPLHDFQDLLEKAFNVCYEALLDNVGWNDAQNLHELSKILLSLPGLEKEARILLSATFSKLRPDDETPVTDGLNRFNGGGAEDDATLGADESDKASNNDSGNEDDDDDEGTEGAEGSDEEEGVNGEDGDHDDAEDEDQDDDDDNDDDGAEKEEDDDPLPTDEGDLIDYTLYCSGECDPNVSFRAWKGRLMYQCLTCYDTFLCEDCYRKRLSYDAGAEFTVGVRYCGKGHKHIKGPLEGWMGIKEGTVSIEAEEPVSFELWLSELKEVKWREAWERFWLLDE